MAVEHLVADDAGVDGEGAVQAAVELSQPGRVADHRVLLMLEVKPEA
jgi:hypothetical protein